MFKQIQSALLISCISVSSYAYVVQTNLTVENKTDVHMGIEIDQPNGTKPYYGIPAHKSRKILLDNEDSSGLLYQTATAPFKIWAIYPEKDTQKNILSVQGRIAYYVGASMWNKYSFLNAVSAADNLKIDTTYSCKNGGYETTFENKIVINGKPGNVLVEKEFPSEVKCQGLKSSLFLDQNADNDPYQPTVLMERLRFYQLPRSIESFHWLQMVIRLLRWQRNVLHRTTQ